MTEQLFKYGIGGIFLVACIVLIKILLKKLDDMSDRHRKEREEWRNEAKNEREEAREDMKKMQENTTKVIEDNTKGFRETGNILTGLKTILENKNRGSR